MRKIFILIVIVSFLACTPKRDVNIDDFNKCIAIVEEYDNYTGEYNDTIIARFCFAVEYLKRTTSINGSFVSSDIPRYKSRSDCLSDIRRWKKWYKLYHLKITSIKSDSIKKVIASENIWWSDSTILHYVFTTKGSHYLY